MREYIKLEFAKKLLENIIRIMQDGEDCISRKALLEQIKERYGNRRLFVDIVRNAPSIVPTIEQSSMVRKWIVYPLMDKGRVKIECPRCGDTFMRAVDYRPHFCENCGARMESGEE